LILAEQLEMMALALALALEEVREIMAVLEMEIKVVEARVVYK
jgi:hypothetical protein